MPKLSTIRRILLVPLLLAASCASTPTEVASATTVPTSVPTMEPTAVVAATSAPSPTTVPTAEPTVAAAATPAAEDDEVEADTEIARITTFLDQLEADGYDGVVAIQTSENEIVRAFGLADREEQIPVTEDTVFSTGSITKQFTGAAILRLEMDGLLSVEDRVGDYIDGLPDEHADVTLHQLLTHSAGYPGAIGEDWDPVDRDDMIELVAETPLQFEPGTAFNYSNPGYSLLGIVIELVTGESYEEYLARALFEPAGMANTGYILPQWEPEVVAVGYDMGEPFGRPNELPWGNDGPYWHLRANGGVMSTATDMLTWHGALLGDDILNVDAKAKLFGRHVEEGDGGGTFYGYGWASFPTAADGWAVAHNGGNGVWFADFWRFLDEGITVYLATNDAQNTSEGLATDIAEAVAGGPILAEGFGTPPSFEELLADIATLPEIGELPDTGAGAAAQAVVDVFLGSAEPDFGQFIADRAPLYFLETAPPEEIENIGEEFRADREYYTEATIEGVYERDASTFHILIDVDGKTEIISVNANDDGRINDFNIDGDPRDS